MWPTDIHTHRQTTHSHRVNRWGSSSKAFNSRFKFMASLVYILELQGYMVKP